MFSSMSYLQKNGEKKYVYQQTLIFNTHCVNCSWLVESGIIYSCSHERYNDKCLMSMLALLGMPNILACKVRINKGSQQKTLNWLMLLKNIKIQTSSLNESILGPVVEN